MIFYNGWMSIADVGKKRAASTKLVKVGMPRSYIKKTSKNGNDGTMVS